MKRSGKNKKVYVAKIKMGRKSGTKKTLKIVAKAKTGKVKITNVIIKACYKPGKPGMQKH